MSSNRKSRVFIVDDHPLVRRGLAELLSNMPQYEVCGEASSVEEAKQGIEQSMPHLVMVDLALKDSNGLELIKWLKTNHPTIKSLVSSMYDEAHFAERALRAGALGFINKQEAAEKTAEAVQRVLAGEIYLSPESTGKLLRGVVGTRVEETESNIESLSDRELEVFDLIGRGLTTREIAVRLGLSNKTIETYREHIKAKLHLETSGQLVYDAVQWVLENR